MKTNKREKNNLALRFYNFRRKTMILHIFVKNCERIKRILLISEEKLRLKIFKGFFDELKKKITKKQSVISKLTPKFLYFCSFLSNVDNIKFQKNLNNVTYLSSIDHFTQIFSPRMKKSSIQTGGQTMYSPVPNVI